MVSYSDIILYPNFPYGIINFPRHALAYKYFWLKQYYNLMDTHDHSWQNMKVMYFFGKVSITGLEPSSYVVLQLAL